MDSLNSNTFSFGPIDHPLIVIVQAICIGGLFRYFFMVHRDKEPVPQIIAALAFAVATNWTGRITKQEWFWIADVAQYGIWAVLIVTAVLSKRKEMATEVKEYTQKPASTHRSIDAFFDTNQAKLNWTVSVVIALGLAYYCVKIYNERDQATQLAEQAAIKENTRVTAEYARQQAEQQAKQDTIVSKVETVVTGLASVSATQQTILAGVTKANLPVPSAKPSKGSKPKKLPIGAFVPLPHRSGDAQINRPVETPPVVPPEKKSFWKKLFGGIIQVHPDSTTTASLRSDTLARH